MRHATEIGKVLDDRPVNRLQLKVTLLCALIVFLDGFDVQALGVAIPAIAADWHLDHTAFAVVLTASLLGVGVGTIFISPLGDRIGRRPLLIWATACVGASTLGMAFATSVTQLLALRFLTGIGLGISSANAAALVSDFIPARLRASFVTSAYCASAVGAIVAGLIAPNLIDRGGWQAIFLIGGILPLLLVPVLIWGLPESIRLLIAKRPDDPRIDHMLATLAADLPRDQVVEDAVLDVRGRFSSLLARRYLPRTLIIWLVFALNLFTLYLLLGWLPTLLTRAGWSKSAAIHAAAILELGALAGALALAYFSQRGKLISALTGLFLIGSICLILLVVVGTSVWEWNLLIFVIGAGTAGSQLVLTALAACLYPTVIRAPA